jgi:hypothetical protein
MRFEFFEVDDDPVLVYGDNQPQPCIHVLSSLSYPE